jgi:hypothetical protein
MQNITKILPVRRAYLGILVFGPEGNLFTLVRPVEKSAALRGTWNVAGTTGRTQMDRRTSRAVALVHRRSAAACERITTSSPVE